MADVVTAEYRLAGEAGLTRFVTAVLENVGVAPDDAAITADVLVQADLRGIESHGVARLESYYVSRLRAGTMHAAPVVTTLRETSTSLAVDAGNGLGHPVAKRTMQRVIDKARTMGSAFATVRNSNHYGIAGAYAMMALEHDMIGIASTNTVRLAVPTFGRDVLLGTNPLAFAIPAQDEPPFVLDFATTVVPRGKLQVYDRKHLPLHDGWAVDADGNQTNDPQAALRGALLPLGGYGTDNGGHKGYGLGLLVEIMCGVLAGGAFGLDLPTTGDERSGAFSHFFAAFTIEGFRDPAHFRADMDVELRSFKESQKARGEDRIYVAGEIEHERTLHNRANGIPIHLAVWTGLERLASALDVPFDVAKRS